MCDSSLLTWVQISGWSQYPHKHANPHKNRYINIHTCLFSVCMHTHAHACPHKNTDTHTHTHTQRQVNIHQHKNSKSIHKYMGCYQCIYTVKHRFILKLHVRENVEQHMIFFFVSFTKTNWPTVLLVLHTIGGSILLTSSSSSHVG
jgi:hypothetical protein